MKSEIQNYQLELETTKAELQATNERFEDSVKKANKIAEYAYLESNNAQQSTKIELQATNERLANLIFFNGNIGIGTTNPEQKLEVNGGLKSPALQSIFVKAPNDKQHNATCSDSWETLLAYDLNLSAPSYVNVLAHGHGFAKHYNSPLDVRIFIDGLQFYDEFWGLGITHSPNWQTLVSLFIKYLSYGKHIIEVKYRSRNSNSSNWVYFNYPSMLIMLTGS